MRIAFSFLPLASLLAGCASPPAAGSAEEGVLRAVLAHEAQSEDMLSYGNVCVRRSLEGAGLDQLREQIRMGMRENPAEDPKGLSLGGWQAPSPAGGASRPVAPELDARLADAAETILARQVRPAGRSMLRSAWVPDSLSGSNMLSRLLGICSSLTLSNPAVAGSLAFVDTAFDCGALCGVGKILALERRGSVWRVVAEQATRQS